MTDTDENPVPKRQPDELRSRLENLRRRPSGDDRRAAKSAPSSGEWRRQPPIVYRRDLPRRPSTGQEIGRPRSRTVVLEEAVDGVEEHHPERGPAFVVRTRVDQVEGAEPCSRAFHQALARAGSPLHPRLAPLCDPGRLIAADVVFVDLETAGLSTAPLFLIGAMTWVDDGLEVQQYLARNYAEEAAAIALFVEHHASRKLLVTFNGKSFDFPFIRTRAAANGIPFSWQPAHFDLLHACRRVWKGAACESWRSERCRPEAFGARLTRGPNFEAYLETEHLSRAALFECAAWAAEELRRSASMKVDFLRLDRYAWE